MTHSSGDLAPPSGGGRGRGRGRSGDRRGAGAIRYEAAVDCGITGQPEPCAVQAEGGIPQGISMALTENVTYDDRGMPQENSLMQYKIPARNDIGHIHVVFESIHEGTSPFGARHRRGGHQHPCPPWPMRSTTPPTSGSMSCPSPASRSRWPGSKKLVENDKFQRAFLTLWQK